MVNLEKKNKDKESLVKKDEIEKLHLKVDKLNDKIKITKEIINNKELNLNLFLKL